MARTTRSRYFTSVFALALVFTFLSGAPGAVAQAPDWTFRAETPFDIWSNDGTWAVGTEMLVLVNNGVSGPEFAGTAVVEQTGPDPADVGWWLNTAPFEIQPDDLITVIDEGPDPSETKNLTVLDLTIDTVDADLETISGTAPAGISFPVHATDGVSEGNLSATADVDGAWTADFAGIFDIRPGTWGSAAIFDDDLDDAGDAIHRSWEIRLPEIQASPNDDRIQGFWWELGATVTVEIDDPDTVAVVDWTGTAIAGPSPWDSEQSYVEFSPGENDFDVAAGQIVTMSVNTTEKILLVAPLDITDIDIDGDLVHGTATPSRAAQVWISGLENNMREVMAASDGTWTADFSIPGDGFPARNIGPGDRIDANEYDDDSDLTYVWWAVPNPQFSVETPNQIWSHGDGWIAGHTATITVDDDHDLTNGALYSTTTLVESWGPEPWEVGWNADTEGFEILPGHVVTVEDGFDIVRTLDVADLLVTDVNESDDTVNGTGPAFAWLSVNGGDEFENADRQVQAGIDGTFTADFGNPGVEDWEQTTLDLRPGVGGSVQVFDDDGDTTHRGWRVADPHFSVDVIHEQMWAADWPIGATLSFDVYEPGDLVNAVWSDSMTVVETQWGQTEAGYRFWGDFDVHDRQVIVMTDGSLTRELIVSTLEVTNVDPDADTYTGTVDPLVEYDATHEVCAWARHLTDDNEGAELCVLPDGEGDWTIDFTDVGRIVPGDHTGAHQFDADGDQTSYAWFVPPWIYVEIGDDANPLFPDRIHLDQWAFPVTVSNGTDTIVVSDSDGDGWEVVDFDVTPGETITASGDDGRVKSLFLEALAVTTVTLWNEDPASTVFGGTTSDYEGQVQVTASADYGWWTERWVPAAGGLYEADFANPGNGWNEQELGYFGLGGADDIYSGGEIRAHIYDGDNDQVQAIWHATNPRIIIVRGNDRIEAIDFPLGEPLTIELDDPAFVGIEFSETGIVGVNPDKPWETLLVVEMGDFTIPDEATVTALDEGGTPLLATVVIPFTIELVDPDTDTITGTAPEGSEVLVEADGNWRYPIADVTNTWVADFSQPGEQPGEENPVDLGPGSSGGATLIGNGGSATTVLWSLSNAQFQVDPASENLWGNEFAPNAQLTITVDDGSGAVAVPGGPYSTDDGGNFGIGFDPSELDLQAGDVVTVDDGTTTKTHTITNLAVTSVDADTNVVSGKAEPGSSVDVWEHQEGNTVTVLACDDTVDPCNEDPVGSWHADFTDVFDLEPGHNGNSGQCDDDDDCTNADWRIPAAQFQVDPASENLWGNEFEPNGSVAVTVVRGVDAIPVPGSPFATDEAGNFGIGFDPNDLDLQAGDVVTVDDGTTAKTHTITNLTVTSVDADTNVVFGTADAFSSVWVNIHNDQGDTGRTVTADALGIWSTDFDDPGDQGGTWDLQPGENGQAQQCDDDNDCTNTDWRAINPSFGVDPGQNNMWGDEFVPDGSVTITVGGAGQGDYPTDGSGHFDAGWDPNDLDLTDGVLVLVTDGVTEKDHTVTPLAITSIAVDTDVMTGTASPNGAFDIWVHDSDAWRHVEVDGTGIWTVDWRVAVTGDQGDGTADLVLGSNGNSNECDDDGDCTWAGWDVPAPSFSVRVDEGEVHGYQWSLGAGVTLEIDDLTNGESVDYSATRWPEPAPWDSEQTWVQFTPGLDGFDLASGQIVTMTNGSVTKFHVVTPLMVTEADAAEDTVTGTTGPDAYLRVEVYDGGFGHDIMSDVNGNWSADFSEGAEQGSFDLVPGTSGEASEYDQDGDSTKQGWEIPTDGAYPEILSFEGPEEPLAFNLDTVATAIFVDPDQGDGHAVELDWGDGSLSHPVPSYEDGVGSVSATHHYDEPGIYTLTVTIMDEAGQSSTETYEYAVIYDPAGRKILATVKVVDEPTSMHLGVNVTPDKKTGTPKGHVRFNMDGSGFVDGFEATEIQYLLIFGDWGIVTGTGTIDGIGEYGFLISVLDQNETGGVDAFRVMIWGDEELVFDSQPGDEVVSMPTTVPTDGDIKVK